MFSLAAGTRCPLNCPRKITETPALPTLTYRLSRVACTFKSERHKHKKMHTSLLRAVRWLLSSACPTKKGNPQRGQIENHNSNNGRPTRQLRRTHPRQRGTPLTRHSRDFARSARRRHQVRAERVQWCHRPRAARDSGRFLLRSAPPGSHPEDPARRSLDEDSG